MGKKLYRVTCRGMQATLAGGQAHGVAYVVADDAAEAYRKVRSALDTRDLGFEEEREMQTVELLAEDGPYPACGNALYA